MMPEEQSRWVRNEMYENKDGDMYISNDWGKTFYQEGPVFTKHIQANKHLPGLIVISCVKLVNIETGAKGTFALDHVISEFVRL